MCLLMTDELDDTDYGDTDDSLLMIMGMGGGWFDDACVTNVDVWHGT